MFTSKEFKNGMVIFIGIALYFLIMEVLGLTDKLYLRLFNVFIVLYGANKTIKENYREGNTEYLNNILSSFKTCVTGIVISIVALIVYVHIRGGEPYLARLSDGFLFVGGKPKVNEYCIGLLFEGIASSVVGCILLMQYWHGKVLKPRPHHH